ncbi:adenylosuccinate synthase [Candidatus Peregrinibacteria bacterium]|nr:adenylosuccinate synthase [Candidatus Peregrinibacteria bacterium]
MNEFIASLGQICAVIGAQWGDEGKGKAVDALTEHFDVIARASGGANAGHTIIFDGKKRVFHLLPSGSFHAGKKIILGAGMVIHLPTLLKEIAELGQSGVEILPRLTISSAAHIVLDCYKDIDAALEERRAETAGKIGTTKRGIGPAYMFKAMRAGIRMESLTRSAAELRREIATIADMARSLFGVSADADGELELLRQAADSLRGCIAGADEIAEFLNSKKSRILIEGAQATLLDLDHGTYPYVTSSATTAAGAIHGLGMAPRRLSSCIGVAKAYCTRVGEGEFITEAAEPAAGRLRERGGEYGATTGRPRRCGWLSIPNLRRSATINGFDCWNITKLDVLDAESEIPVFMETGGSGALSWKKLPGWQASTVGATDFGELPERAQDFIAFIEQETQIPVRLIGTGQRRGEMIVRNV